MPAAAKHVQEGYTAVTPYMCIKGAAEALDFYQRAFGAKELFRMPRPDGRIGHAEIEIDGARIMLADELPENGFRGPASLGGSSIHLHLYVEDCDRLAEQAIAAGAKLTRPMADQFYGDRSGTVLDPFGHTWHIATHKEDFTEEEVKKSAAAAHCS